MGFKSADSVWPGKKEHGSSWISDWKALLFSSTVQTAALPLLPLVPQCTSQSKGKLCDGYCQLTLQTPESKQSALEEPQWYHRFYSKFCDFLLSFLPVYFLMLYEYRYETPLYFHWKAEKREKRKNGLLLWRLSPEIKRTHAWMSTLLNPLSFSRPSLLFVRDLTHNFQKQTGRTADISKYFLCSPLPPIPHHHPSPLLCLLHFWTLSYSFCRVCNQTVLLHTSYSMLRQTRPSFAQVKGQGAFPPLDRTKRGFHTAPLNISWEIKASPHYAPLHCSRHSLLYHASSPLLAASRGCPSCSAGGSLEPRGCQRQPLAAWRLGTGCDLPQHLPTG